MFSPGGQRMLVEMGLEIEHRIGRAAARHLRRDVHDALQVLVEDRLVIGRFLEAAQFAELHRVPAAALDDDVLEERRIGTRSRAAGAG